jgi:hypothetical protein
MFKKNTAWKQIIRNVSIALSIMLIPVAGVSADDHKGNGHHRNDHHDSGLLFPADQPVFGKKMNEWSAEWWQYMLSMPKNPNPLLDKAGGYCANVQHGPVWLLAGGIAEANTIIRTCSIPEGRALFFPLVNGVDVNTTAQPVNELRAEIAGCIDAAFNLSVELDGRRIPYNELERSRVRSVPFSVVFPADGLPLTPPTPAGIYSPAVDDGYYVMMRPLPVGPHTLRFTGASPGCDYPPTGVHMDPISVDVTYELTIVPVSLH